jgi:MFS family permease/HAMP domain-containing protein
MKKLQERLVLFVVVMFAFSALLLSWLSLRHFEQGFPPEMAKTVTAVGYSASAVLERAYENGVPLEQMVGVEDFFAEMRKENPSISYMVLSDNQGNILHQSGLNQLSDTPDLHSMAEIGDMGLFTRKDGAYFNTSMPVTFHHHRIATFQLGQRTEFVEQKLREVTYDILTVLVVASLIAIELLRFTLTFVITTPVDVMRDFLKRIREQDFSHYLPYDRLGGIGQLGENYNHIVETINRRMHALKAAALTSGASIAEQVDCAFSAFRFHSLGERRILFASVLDHIRWPFFLLIFADSLSLSFFPMYVGQFYSPALGLSKNFVIGLPISIFMFTWALSMPWAGMWSDRVGHRKAFVVGAVITTAGLILTACAQTLYDLLMWRSLTALGYGLVFITAQSYITNNTPVTQRTKGMAVFLSTFFAGSLSGSAIGGILSDRLGASSTIFLSALLSVTAGLVVLRFIHSSPASSPKKVPDLGDFRRLVLNKKFSLITFLAAIPAKIALTGFLYYSVPLYLKLLGNNQSTTGRVMMAYGLSIIILSPSIAKLADRIGRLRWFVSIGGYAAALAMFVIYFFDNMAGILVSITLLGIAHAIGVSPQLALINDFCKEVVQEVGSGTASGIFRLIERLGNVAGPIIAGILISQFGFGGAFLGIGIISLTCITSFTILLFLIDRKSVSKAHISN